MCAQTTGIDRKTGKTHRQEDGSDIGMEKKIVTQKLEDPTTLPQISHEHLHHKNPTTVMIVTAVTRDIPTHQSIYLPTRRITISIA